MRKSSLRRWVPALAIALCALPHSLAAAVEGDRFTLANGLRVWVAPSGPATRGLCEVLLSVAAGSGEERPGESGAAWMTARALTLLDGGEDPRRALARLGMSLDVTVERGIAQIGLTGPGDRCLPALRILAGLLARPALPAAAWSAAEAEWRQGQARESEDAQAQGDRRLSRLAWSEPAEPPASTVVGAGRLEAFRARAYVGSRMALAVRGDLAPAAAEAEIRRSFSSLPAGAVAASPGEPAAARPVVAAVECLRAPGIEPPLLLVGRGVEIADDADFFGWQALAHILGESHSSRLVRRLRLEEPLVYTVETDWLTAGRRRLTLRVACQTEDVERSRAVIREEMGRLAEREVTPRELATAVAILRSRLLLDRESPHAELARWARGVLAPVPGLDLAAAGPLVDRLTPAGLLALARRGARPEVTVVIGDPSSLPLCAAAEARSQGAETNKEGDR